MHQKLYKYAYYCSFGIWQLWTLQLCRQHFDFHLEWHILGIEWWRQEAPGLFKNNKICILCAIMHAWRRTIVYGEGRYRKWGESGSCSRNFEAEDGSSYSPSSIHCNYKHIGAKIRVRMSENKWANLLVAKYLLKIVWEREYHC